MTYKVPWHPGPGFVTPEIPFPKRADDLGPSPSSEPPAPAPAAEEEPVEPPPLSASEGMHPFSISPEEGLPAVPHDQLLKKLAGLAALKAGAVLMYFVYSDALRGPARDGLAAHFEEHAAEERAGLYDLNMKIIALGGTASMKASKAPDARGTAEILTHVMQTEKQLIEKTRDLITAAGEYAGLRLMLEDNLLKDQKHLDDARRMLVSLP